MKKFILVLICWAAGLSSLQAQSLVNKDSLAKVRQARSDSLKQIQQARRDSIEQRRKEREAKVRAEKKNKKNDLEEFSQNDFTHADTLRALAKERRDSLKAVRDEEARMQKLKKQEAQRLDASKANPVKKILPLTQEMSAGFRLNSDGWSIFTNRGFIKSDEHKTLFLSIDLSEKKHPKETRTLNETFISLYPNEVKPLPYKYGKVNNFYQLKVGFGSMYELSGRLDRKSVTISCIINGGISFGLLKPYYLDLLVPEGNTYVRKYEKYSEQNKTYFLDLNNQGTILGGSYFTRGLGELQINPGLHVKSGFYFDYAATRKSFLGVEIGASVEAYLHKIEIMKTASNRAVFINFYADIRFGKRWE